MKEVGEAIALAIVVAIIVFVVSLFLRGGAGEHCNRDGTCNNGLLRCVVVPEQGHRCVVGGAQ